MCVALWGTALLPSCALCHCSRLRLYATQLDGLLLGQSLRIPCCWLCSPSCASPFQQAKRAGDRLWHCGSFFKTVWVEAPRRKNVPLAALPAARHARWLCTCTECLKKNSISEGAWLNSGFIPRNSPSSVFAPEDCWASCSFHAVMPLCTKSRYSSHSLKSSLDQNWYSKECGLRLADRTLGLVRQGSFIRHISLSFEDRQRS